MAKWCKYCKGSSRYWCEVTGEYIPYEIVERSCKNDGYKCNHWKYYVSTMTGALLEKKPEDPVLESIRSLKDDFIEPNEEYTTFNDMYDFIGPLLANGIYHDENREEVTERLYNILTSISKFVEDGKIDRAINYYCRMIGALINKYGLDEIYNKAADTMNQENESAKKVKKINKTLE